MKNFKGLVSCCSWCGISNWHGAFICSRCWQRLFDTSIYSKKMINRHKVSLKVSFLWNWKSGNDARIVHLIYGLKGSCHKNAFEEIAHHFRNQWVICGEKMEDPPIFVPAPAKESLSKDHAYLWAQALALAFKGDVAPIFYRVLGGPQKGKRRNDREAVKMRVCLNSLKLLENFRRGRPYIFVDDVLTTGATAREAYRRLGRPDNFRVWVVSYRSFLL